ncbi:SDR family oxidoreductase [Acidianus ambivalens]|uniref:SDR family NAD(P)-dependent oxidoreductase n=1 Tax=Acidianus ambivalens TaxID=2283 RepID=A0A650CSZ1_ACIAM|nr:SDR family oxidoreductase [Acidianus ambivalens]MQL55413.1 SDR family NAD(P)-dependent oxidoreductase [Acidianus ambivalens]QGR20950.1 SDR family NAD(P)-dependent oxidoreductase [Acidianus ambivalens]
MKRALITASTEGIGKGIAKALAKQSFSLVITSRSEEKVKKAVEELRAINPSIWGKTSDMTNLKSLEELVSFSIDKMGGIDLLVVNTGNPSKEPLLFEETTDEDWEYSVKLYLLSAVKLTKLVLPKMKEQHFGRIIYLSSWTVKEPQDIFVLADVSRAPLIQLAKILSKDYGKYNITFNVILMGSFNTPGASRGIERLAKARKKSFEEVWKEEVLDRIPLGRIGDPEKDLGKLILFLYDSDYITGTSILIDGGNTRAV